MIMHISEGMYGWKLVAREELFGPHLILRSVVAACTSVPRGPFLSDEVNYLLCRVVRLPVTQSIPSL